MSGTKIFAAAVALLLGLASGGADAAGDAAKGGKVFKKCKACHTLIVGKHKIGPSLNGVIGRQAGTADGYKYSKAMTAYGSSGVVWDQDSLDIYLEAPRKVVKGTKMAFPGLKKPQDREDVIAHIMTASQ